MVVGHSIGERASQAFRWTQATGMVRLDDAIFSLGLGVSADGNVAVGSDGAAASWSGGITTQLGFFGAYGTNGDGSVIVGNAVDQSVQAVRWTGDTGPVGLGFLPGSESSIARAVSHDGTVVVGDSRAASGDQAFRWTSESGMTSLGGLSEEYVESSALGISPDGLVVVGVSWNGVGIEAYRWTEGGGMVGLGGLPGGSFSAAYGVAETGMIVGLGLSDSGEEALFWNQSLNRSSVRDFLMAQGVSGLENWQLTGASAISADGRTIVGRGINPQGFEEAWVATIPEPSTAVLIVLGAALPLGRAIRRGRRW